MLRRSNYGGKFGEKRQLAFLKGEAVPDGDISFGNPMRRHKDG
jgi:hypothetical protein